MLHNNVPHRLSSPLNTMAAVITVFPTSAMHDNAREQHRALNTSSLTPHHMAQDVDNQPPAKRPRHASVQDDGTSTDDEDAAELLLNMGVAVVAHSPAIHHGAQPASSHDSDYSPQPARRRSDYACMQCLGPVSVSGERRPTFVCTRCRSKTGYSKRAHKALLAADLRVQVTAYEAAHRAGPREPAAAVREDSGASSKDNALGGAGVEQDVGETTELQGRCKCGMCGGVGGWGGVFRCDLITSNTSTSSTSTSTSHHLSHTLIPSHTMIPSPPFLLPTLPRHPPSPSQASASPPTTHPARVS